MRAASIILGTALFAGGGCADPGPVAVAGTTGGEGGTSEEDSGSSSEEGGESSSSGGFDPGPTASQCTELPEAREAAWRSYTGKAYDDDPDARASEVAAVVDAHTRFGLELYHELAREADDGDNVLISPFSMHTAMAMAYSGARNEPAREIAETMHYDALPDDRLHVAMNRLQLELADRALPETEEESAVELAVANSVWIQNGYPHEQAFVDGLSRNYDVETFSLDFLFAPEPARAVLNCWVAEQTRGRITELFPEKSITEDARVVLTNALYLLAPWEYAFEEDLTHDAPFTRPDGSKVSVPTMHALSDYPYFGDEEVQALELPMRGDPVSEQQLSMVLLLPTGDVDAFASTLDADRLTSITDGLAEDTIDVAIPKFEFRYGTVRLNDQLQNLGIERAFDCCNNLSDFTGIAPNDYLFIHGVYHQTFIAVDERGVEATAASGVVIGVGFTAPPEPVPAASFHADRPFLVVIRDRATNAILFFGRVADP